MKAVGEAWLLLMLVGGGCGARILALFPLPFYSHTHTFLPVFRELVTRGHHLTFVSPYPQPNPPHNWTDIAVDKKPLDNYLDSAVKDLLNANRYSFFLHFWSLCYDMMDLAYQDVKFKKLVRSDTLDFDVIIMEALFCHESLVALGHLHNIPIIAVYPHALAAWPSFITGNDFLPSYIPDYRTTYSDKMNLIERLDNTLLTIVELATGLYYYLPKQEMLMKREFYTNIENPPSLLELLKNISLHLIDSHYSMGYARPHQPNSIPVGGLSIMNAGQLPKDLEDYLDNSPNGVIYLSFGSHLPVSSTSRDLINAILSAFRDLNINVLMKWENDTLENKPLNVKIQKWFPQASILAHPKCRLFITHGGLHSLAEAVYFGVPIIGIPFFSDQLFNLKYAAQAGFGYPVLKEEITAEKFRQAIETVLTNKLYKENAVRWSKITRDRPEPVMNSTIFWIEYTIRHKDLSHLRPASTFLSFYQLFLLDVLLIIFVIIVIPPSLLYCTIKKFLNYSKKSNLYKTSKSKKD